MYTLSENKQMEVENSAFKIYLKRDVFGSGENKEQFLNARRVIYDIFMIYWLMKKIKV